MLTKLEVTTAFEATVLHVEPARKERFNVGDGIVLLHTEGGHQVFARFPAEYPHGEFITTDLASKAKLPERSLTTL